MNESTLLSAEPNNEAEYQATMQHLLAEIRLANAGIEQEQNRILRLRIETEALRGETLRLRTETRAALARMGEPV